MHEYTFFYGFSEDPFKVIPDPRFFFLSENNREALACINYGINERKGFILISGEQGIGKTTLIQHLSSKLDGLAPAVIIAQPGITIERILEQILLKLNLTPDNQQKTSLIRRLNAHLVQEFSRGGNLAVFIDDAHKLSREVTEDLRLLSNLETTRSRLLQIVLVGRPEIDINLGSKDLKAFKQRIAIRGKIGRLTEDESKEYIEHHLKGVGSSSLEVFTPEAVSLICRRAKGIPRSINLLCDDAFSVGYQRSRNRIDSPIVREAFKKRHMQKQWLSGNWALGEKFFLRKISQIVEKGFDKAYIQKHRLSSLWDLGQRSLFRKISYIVEKGFDRAYTQKHRLSSLWGLGQRSLFRKISYSALAAICLMIGIFPVKEHIEIPPEKAGIMPLTDNLIVAGKVSPPISEGGIDVFPKEFPLPSLEKIEPKPLIEQLPIMSKNPVHVPAREKKIPTKNFQAQALERRGNTPNAGQKVGASREIRKIDDPSMNFPSIVPETVPLPDQFIASASEKPKNLEIKKLSQEVPVITHSFASKQMEPGDIWKVYLNASYPNGDMKYIVSSIEKGGSHLNFIRLKEKNRHQFSGYIYLTTASTKAWLNLFDLTLTIWIQDSDGHLSQPVLFPLSFQTNVIPEKPPQDLFEQQDLGPIMTELSQILGNSGA